MARRGRMPRQGSARGRAGGRHRASARSARDRPDLLGKPPRRARP